MGVNSSRAHQDARTDPTLPRIPALDDRSLAELLAELDIDERPGATTPPLVPVQPPVSAEPPSVPAEPPSVPAEPPSVSAEPSSGHPDSRSLPRQRTPSSVPSVPPVPSLDARSRTSPTPPSPTRRTFGPPDDPSVLCQSADGPVLRSRHGDHRPPVTAGRCRDELAELPEAPSLTGLGLTRRSWGRFGSLLFTWAFIMIFTLILAETVIGLLSSATSP